MLAMIEKLNKHSRKEQQGIKSVGDGVGKGAGDASSTVTGGSQKARSDAETAAKMLAGGGMSIE